MKRTILLALFVLGFAVSCQGNINTTSSHTSSATSNTTSQHTTSNDTSSTSVTPPSASDTSTMTN